MSYLRSSAFICGFILPLAMTGCASAAGPKTDEFRLDNGLKVIIRPVKGAQQAALIVLYSLGGNHDPEGRSGLHHLLEHVYVTAAAGETKARTVDEFTRLYPGGWNAQTGEDFTIIATVFPRQALDSELKDAAARMGDLRIEASDLEREKPRLLAEVANMYGGMPALAALNLARERVRPSPGSGRKGGVPEQVSAITVAELRDRWRRYYKPANATLVLAGALDPKAARTAIEKYFGKLPPGEAAPPPRAPGKSRTGVEEVPVRPRVPGAGSEASMTYLAPPAGSADYAPFLILVGRMRNGASKIGDVSPQALQSRFPPPVYYAVLDDPAVFSVNTPVRAGETAQQAAVRLEAFVAETVQPDLKPADIAAAREMFGMFLGVGEFPETVWAQNPYALALSLGRRAQLGIDPAKLQKDLAALTTADLRRCAQAVFAPERRAAVVALVRK
jgi:predicted Zn-dependent peptidase